VLLVETPLNITVIRLTQLGIDVKSIEVPLVDACAVMLVIMLPLGVPAKVGLVKVGVVSEALVRLGLSPDIVIAIIKPLFVLTAQALSLGQLVG